MKTIALILAILCGAAANLLGQGYIYFSNRVPEAGLDVAVYSVDGATRWGSPGTVVQLFVAPVEKSDFVAVGEAVEVGTSIENVGSWHFHDDLDRVVEFANPGDQVLVEVRGWEIEFGASYEEAREEWSATKSGHIGVSELFPVILGAENSPAYLISDHPGLWFGGLIMFPNATIPEPATWWSFAIGCVLVCWVLMARKSRGRPGHLR